MRNFLTYLLLTSFVLHACSKLVVQLNFIIHQDFIAENLCENKDKPVMQCNGSCHLKKELKKDDERKEQSVKNQVEFLAFYQEVKPIEFNEITSFDNEESSLFDDCSSATVGYITSIFHPPSSI